MSGEVPSEGFVYLSYGASYLDETSESIGTLLRWNPTARVCLLTDEAGQRYWQAHYAALPLDRLCCVPLSREEPFCLFRTRLCALSPYHKTIALDSDTYILADIRGLFDLLETFDFAAVPDEAHPAKGSIIGLRGGYAALNYYNGGVLLFRKSPATERLFERWKQEYLACAPLDGSDEGPLVRALIHTEVRFITLPREYNLRLTNKCVSFQGRVKIIHGRVRHPEKLAAMLNKIDLVDRGSRVWIPTLQRVIRATAFYPYAQLLRLFNLDEVQYRTSGRAPRTSVPQNLKALGRQIWRRLTLRMARRSGEPVRFQPPDPSVWEYLTQTCGVRSLLALTAQSWRSGASRLGQVVDVVWYDAAQPITIRAVPRLIEALTHHAARLIVITYRPPQASEVEPTNLQQHSWYWIQVISDRGLYFDPYLTLALRQHAQAPHVQQTGLVFECVMARSTTRRQRGDSAPCLAANIA